MPTQAAPQAANQAANSDEQAANVRSPIAASGGEQFAAQWLTVAEVAERLGVTPRAIQKRCKAGKLDAHSVETPTGEQWEINAASVETQSAKARSKAANRATNQAANSREQAANFGGEQPRTAANSSQPQPDAERPKIADRDDAAPDYRARYIAELEAANGFLKSQLEDSNRNAAELRAALRKALEIAPRQLTQGNAPAPQKSAATKDSHADASGPHKPAKRDGATDWNSIYGQIADDLEAQELNR